MNELSYTQEFYLCAINSKGKIPMLKETEISACLMTGGILELLDHGCLRKAEKDKLVVVKELSDKLSHFSSIHETVAAFKKPKNIKALTNEYIFGLTPKINDLVRDIGASLAKDGYTEILLPKSRISKSIRYRPKADATTRVIEKVRAEFLEEGIIDDEVICLTALLIKSGLIKDYFSKVEGDRLKARIKEIRESVAYATIKEVLDYIDLLIAVVVTAMAATSIASSNN